MDSLDRYFELQEKIYNYFSYIEDWCVFPINDSRDYYWSIKGDNVYFAKNEENVFDGTIDDGYSNEIYHQRFLSKAIYEGKEYTMIVVDTHTDGNKFLRIFDNKKRCV